MFRSTTLLIALAVVFLIGLIPDGAWAQIPARHDSVSVLRLDSLIRDVEANPSLRAARLEVRALATRRDQASALPDPNVMFGYRPLGFDAATDAVPRLALQQTIPFPGKLELSGEVAELAADAAGHRADAFAADLVLQIKLSYYELYRVQEQDRLIRQFQHTLDRFEEAASVRYEVGRGSQQAILKAQLERNALVRERLKLSEERRTLVETLARLSNRPDLVSRAGSVIVSMPEVAIDTLRAARAALARRPEAAALQSELAGAEAEVALAKRAFLPDFMLEVGFMDMGGMNGLTSLGHRFMIGGGITIPLQSGRRRAALEEARLRRAQIAARREALRTEIQTRINELNNRLREEARALALYENTIVPQAEATLEATLSAYTTGRTDFLDLLDAERMLFDVHVERVHTYSNYLKSAAELERVMGVRTLDNSPVAQSKISD